MKKTILFIGVSTLLVNCRDPYDIPVKPTDKSLLVVEGVLNSGVGPTTISLTKSGTTDEFYTPKPELNAQLVVEGKDNSTQALTGNGSGIYSSPQLTLKPDVEYRLRINTSDGKQFASDFVKVYSTPAIDSVSWKKENDGLTVYVNTHDAAGNAGYYLWDYVETWEYHASFVAHFKWDPAAADILPMLPSEDFYYCWRNNTSKTLLLASSAQYQTDIIHEMPLVFIPKESEKISVRYSILVHQRKVDKTGYEYLQMMKKNTEQLGSIFDAQPSELRGNIHCLSNPEETVIGYLTATSMTEKRIFITNAQAGYSYLNMCDNYRISNDPDTVRNLIPNPYLPFDIDLTNGGGWYVAPAPCVDCRLRGGFNVKPAFW
jgi:hypothetical protein